LDIPEERVYFVRDELCEGGTTRRRRSHDEAQGTGTGSKGDPSAAREESLDALLVHGEHRGVRISWDGEADLPETKTTLRMPFNLKLGGWKAVLNDVGKDVAKRLIASARPN